MKRVIIESPYAGDIEANRAYLRKCLRDSIDRGEAPIASHLIYPFILREELTHERQLGIELGFAWWPAAELICFYTDRGFSPGMDAALRRAVRLGTPWEMRQLPPAREGETRGEKYQDTIGDVLPDENSSETIQATLARDNLPPLTDTGRLE